MTASAPAVIVEYPGPEPFLNREEIATFMKVSPRTITKWCAEGMPYETWGLRTRVYRASEVIEWARQR